MIAKVVNFSHINTFEQVVSSDFDEMVATVKDEIKDTLGIPRPRKVAAYKEAEARMDGARKSIKH